MSVLEIFGMEEGFFYENVGFISVYLMLVLIVIFGIKFILDGSKFEKGLAQRAYFIGLGLFIISVAIGEGIYLLDLVFRSHTGARIFFPLTDAEGEISWQSIVDYPLASIIDRDYYIVVFTIILIALSFLMKPLELFMLRKEKGRICLLNRILIPFPFLIRFFEVISFSVFGVQIIENSIPYYIFSAFWVFVVGVVVLSILILIGLYFKMAITAPKGSSLKKKSLLIIIGILLWLITIFSTATIFREISSGSWYFIPVIPIMLLVSLYLMIYGFKRDY